MNVNIYLSGLCAIVPRAKPTNDAGYDVVLPGPTAVPHEARLSINETAVDLSQTNFPFTVVPSGTGHSLVWILNNCVLTLEATSSTAYSCNADKIAEMTKLGNDGKVLGTCLKADPSGTIVVSRMVLPSGALSQKRPATRLGSPVNWSFLTTTPPFQQPYGSYTPELADILVFSCVATSATTSTALTIKATPFVGLEKHITLKPSSDVELALINIEAGPMTGHVHDRDKHPFLSYFDLLATPPALGARTIPCQPGGTNPTFQDPNVVLCSPPTLFAPAP